MQETQHAVTFKTTFYTVPKVAGATGAGATGAPPASFAKYVVPEDVVREAAAGSDTEFDFSSYWVVDESCPRQLLGMGVSRIELSLASTTRVKRDAGASSSAPQAPALEPPAVVVGPPAQGGATPAQGGAIPAQDGATPAQGGATPAQGGATPAPAPTQENQVIIDLISNTQAAAGKGKFWSPDQNDSSTVELWARMVVEALEDMKKKAGDLPTEKLWSPSGPFGAYCAVFKRFASFLSQLLQESGTVSALHRFSAADDHVRATGAKPQPIGCHLESHACVTVLLFTSAWPPLNATPQYVAGWDGDTGAWLGFGW